ncbi:MAG: hypothetical protein HYU97_05230 [Deltaproteobacteria bacterium]|nr:hypothetical protein [Deltaproteobacteria bacterium]
MRVLRGGILSILLSILLSSGIYLGCGGGGGDSSVNDYEPTDTDVANTSTTSSNVALQLFSVGNSSLSLPLGNVSFDQVEPPFESAITSTPTSSCSEASLPSVTGTSFNGQLYGSTFNGDGSGVCTLKVDMTSNIMAATAACDLFYPGAGSFTQDMTIDGTVGASASISEVSDSVFQIYTEISSQGLQFYFKDSSDATKICDVVLNLADLATITISEGSATYSRSVSGCAEICNQAFSMSGSESGTLTTQ